MSWIKMVLDVASLGVEIANTQKLEQLRRQGIVNTFTQNVIRELRDQIFNYKQMAESILTTEATSPKQASGAIKILEARFNTSGITPDLFSELSDKDYVASV